MKKTERETQTKQTVKHSSRNEKVRGDDDPASEEISFRSGWDPIEKDFRIWNGPLKSKMMKVLWSEVENRHVQKSTSPQKMLL